MRSPRTPILSEMLVSRLPGSLFWVVAREVLHLECLYWCTFANDRPHAGHLSLMLTRYLYEEKVFPLPSAVMLYSVCDLISTVIATLIPLTALGRYALVQSPMHLTRRDSDIKQ